MADKYNNPSYAVKANLLRKIDDAASQFSTSKPKPNMMRDIGAKSTAQKVLNKNLILSSERPLGKAELEKLNSQQPETTKAEPTEAGRSMKSEYDYGSKRKFVDVLGNVNKKNTFMLTGGLNQQDDMKSVRSKYTEISRRQGANQKETMPSIDEFEEIRLVNSKGETIELN